MRFLRESRQRLIFNIPKVQMQNAVTCCESPRLSPLVRDKGVARWRTPFGAGISFCFCVESEITIITMITVTIIGRKKSYTMAGVYILQFAVVRFNKWQEMFSLDTGILFQKLWEVTWHDLKQKKKKGFSLESNCENVCKQDKFISHACCP